MSGVVNIMKNSGYNYEYWEREDGYKMYGEYIVLTKIETYLLYCFDSANITNILLFNYFFVKFLNTIVKT